MKVQIGEDEYRIEFEHGSMTNRRRTTCVIRKRSAAAEPASVLLTVAMGDALCSPGDQFSKEAGRKLSLTRALEGFPREHRKLFWTAYHNRPRHYIPSLDDIRHGLAASMDAMARFASLLPGEEVEDLMKILNGARGQIPGSANHAKCEAIVQAILQRCNEVPEGGWQIAFGPDWGGNALTVYDAKLGHTHVGDSDEPFEQLIDGLHALLCRGAGLSFFGGEKTLGSPDGLHPPVSGSANHATAGASQESPEERQQQK